MHGHGLKDIKVITDKQEYCKGNICSTPVLIYSKKTGNRLHMKLDMKSTTVYNLTTCNM
jgi:hypothetical protein